MKKIFLVAILFFSFVVQAQFNINGEVKDFSNKPVIFRVYENGISKFLSRVETDKKGQFSYKVPFAYKGVITMEVDRGAYTLISNNKDIDFTLSSIAPGSRITFKEGVNKQFSDYNDFKTYLNIKDRMLLALESFYQPEQEFYAAIVKEQKRIENLKPVKITDDNLNYYLEMESVLNSYSNGAKTDDAVKKDALKHLVNDGMEIENFGFLPQFVTQYLSHSMGKATTQQEGTTKLKKSVDELLSAVGEDTARGQSILLTVISLLQNSNFKNVANDYMHRAESLTCEVTPELKELIQGNKNVQVGKKVPNIVFDKPIKGKKSLYDIKADKKLVLFWGSWCAHCKHEMPFVKEFYKDFKKSGGEIFAFAVDLSKDDYLPMIKDTDWYNYSDLLKWDSPIVREFGVDGTPTFILLDKDNKVIKTGSRVSQFVDFSGK